MNVYDFDGTIYRKDSSVELYKYIAKKNLFVVMRCMPEQLLALVKYKFHLISKEKLKEVYFSFLKYIDLSSIMNEFIDKSMKDINPWYLKQHCDDDVIISASPRFLIEKFAERLNVLHVIATEVDIDTGKFESKNCHGEEKVIRFRECFSDEMIDNFYSDSKSDLPMARIAKHAYLIKENEPQKWEL